MLYENSGDILKGLDHEGMYWEVIIGSIGLLCFFVIQRLLKTLTGCAKGLAKIK